MKTTLKWMRDEIIDWLKSRIFRELVAYLTPFVGSYLWFFWETLRENADVMRNLILLIAGIVGWYFLARRTKAAEREAKTAEQGLIVDRLARAIEQIDNKKSSVRLGGVLGLEQIANTHEEERKKIARVLLSFIRTHATKDSEEVKKNLTACGLSKLEHVNGFSAYRLQRLDVEAAVNALARIASNLEKQGQFRLQYNENKSHLCDLQDIDLRGLRFVEADLSQFCLAGADLSGAWMTRANLTNTILHKTDFSGKPSAAKLTKAFLGSTNFSGAQLNYVDFSDSQLENANFSGTRLYEAVFVEAYLSEASFYKARPIKADFTGAYLEQANLNCAILTRATLDNAILDRAILKNTSLRGATLNDTSFHGVTGLTQEQLKEARCQKWRPPLGLPNGLMQPSKRNCDDKTNSNEEGGKDKKGEDKNN